MQLSVGHYNLFKPEDFAALAEQRVLLLCYSEESEKELLNSEQFQQIKTIDILLECHECLIPGITNQIIRRFEASHDITIVLDNGQRQLLNSPKWFNNLSHLDQLLATWEWRSGPTPWLVMKAKPGMSL